MAAYFIKYKYYFYKGADHKSTIIDFDKFEKVNNESIYRKLSEATCRTPGSLEIEDIVKL